MSNKQYPVPFSSTPGSGGGGGAVSSVFGRTGAVTAQAGDYTWDQIGNAAGNLTLANAAFTTTFDQTSAVNWTWANTTIATVSTTNASPNIVLQENYWTGSASAADTWTIGSALAAGSNAVSTLSIGHAGSTNSTPRISFFVAAAEALRISLHNPSSAGTQVIATEGTNQSLEILSNLTSSTAVPAAVQIQNAVMTATSGTQTGFSVGSSAGPINFAPSSGTAAFIGVAAYSTAVSSSSSGAVTGFLVSALGNQSVSGTFLTTDFQNDNGSVFQVGPTGAIFPSGTGTGTLTDNSASTGGAHCVLTAGSGGGAVVWDTAGVSAGPLTPTSMTTVKGLVTAFTGTSDERLKDYVPYEGGLNEILAITPAKYTWNEKGQKHTGISGEQEFVGFIAQDVQKAIPEAITASEPSKDGTEKYLAFDDRPVIAALVNAVKTLEARIKELEAR